MSRWRSIEFRVAAWYSFLLLTSLLVIAGLLWFAVDYSMVAAVDDQLHSTVDQLLDVVDAEFGIQLLSSTEPGAAGECSGTIDGVDPRFRWFSIRGTKIHLRQETAFETGSAEFERELLREGQFVEVEVEKDEDLKWHALEVALERGLELELLEELYELSLALPEGRLIQIRTLHGEQVLPYRSEPIVPWQKFGTDRTLHTVGGSGDTFRVLSSPVVFAGVPHEVQVAASLASVVATQERLAWWLFWMLPSAVVLSFAGGYGITRAALRPVQRVADLASRTDIRRLSDRLEVPETGDVVEKLATTFNEMLSRLEAAVSALQQFTADASHELRSPVSVIRTTAELALRQARNEQDLRSDMGEIHDEARRLTELIEDLLALARADGASESLPMDEIDLGALAREVCEQHGRFANGRQLDCDVEAQRVVVRGHGHSLRRLLVILVDNAARHTPSDANITLSIRIHGDQVEVAVKDTGPGIAPDELARIFDRFYRGDASRNRGQGGFGLGLSIAKWIAESHHGTIAAESMVGKGSVFRVRLPKKNI